MKLKFEVCRCDMCNKLFEKDFIPMLKIDRNNSDTTNNVSYIKVDLCNSCDKKMASILTNAMNTSEVYEHTDSKRTVIFS